MGVGEVCKTRLGLHSSSQNCWARARQTRFRRAATIQRARTPVSFRSAATCSCRFVRYSRRITNSVYLPSAEASVGRGGWPRQINRVELNHAPSLGRVGRCCGRPMGIGSPEALVGDDYGRRCKAGKPRMADEDGRSNNCRDCGSSARAPWTAPGPQRGRGRATRLEGRGTSGR